MRISCLLIFVLLSGCVYNPTHCLEVMRVDKKGAETPDCI